MGPRGNRPELFEPGAQIIYRNADKETRSGVVERSTDKYVHLADGALVRKDRVLGPDPRKDGPRQYRVVLHHGSGTRMAITLWAKTAAAARERAQAKADRLFGLGTWAACGSKGVAS